MRSRHLLAALALVALVAALARELNNERITRLPGGDPAAGWFSFDPDTHYHVRRLERLLDEGLPVAPSDPWMNHPEGARIPWPPYYTLVLRVSAALGVEGAADAPRLESRAARLERAVAGVTLPFGVLTALLVALAAARLARRDASPHGALAAALVAGGVLALLGGSIHYSAPGNGDHHAFATLLMAVLFALIAEGSRAARLASARAGAGLGLLAGAVAGLLVGCWVGGLVYVLIVQAALGWLLLCGTRATWPGLAWLGAVFHLVAAAVLAPAVLASPWKEELPWMVVNLSWFHLAHLALGALVFLPLLARGAARPVPRAWPWSVLVVLGALGLGLATLDVGVARGVREGFAWAGRSNEFMAFIGESQPLLWGQDGSFAVLARHLGYAPLALLPAWLVAAWWALRRGEHALVVWVVAVPPLLVQALLQRRFADALGPSMAVVLGWAAARCAVALVARRERPPAVALTAALALVAVLALEAPTVARTLTRVRAGEVLLRGPQAALYRAQRELYEWIAARPRPAEPGAVLAAWYHGHLIESVARRPSVATNFGSYVGVEGYLAPWRFFLEEDEAAGEALLAEREVDLVLVDGGLTNDLEVMLRLVRPDERAAFLERTPSGMRPSARWYGTLGARLTLEGRAVDLASSTASDSLDFLRLVHVSSAPFGLGLTLPWLPPGQVPPVGWVWERVAGARVEARGAPGEELRVQVELAYPGRERTLVWTRGARVGPDGVARLRVPYCTDAANGDGRARGPARWSLGARSGSLSLRETDVLAGAAVPLP